MKLMQAVVFLAVAASAAADVPRYHKAARDFDFAVRSANNINNRNVIPRHKRDYIQLVAFICALADDLSQCIGSYDELYLEVLNRTVPYAWRYPNLIAHSILAFNDEAKQKIAHVRRLVDHYCGADKVLALSDSRDSFPSGCDVMVDLEIKNKPRVYFKGAHLLLELGKLMALYTDEDLIQEAHNLNMIPFMINGKNDLKELVTQHSLVRSLLRDKVNPTCNPYIPGVMV